MEEKTVSVCNGMFTTTLHPEGKCVTLPGGVARLYHARDIEARILA